MTEHSFWGELAFFLRLVSAKMNHNARKHLNKKFEKRNEINILVI